MQEGENANRDLTIQGSLTQLEQSSEDLSHEELVRNIQATLAEEKRNWEERNGKDTFDAAMWIGENFSMHKSFREAARNDARGDKAYRARDFSRVWDAIAEPHMKASHDYRAGVRFGLEAAARVDGRYVTLDPQSVKMLDAMAEAIGIPHTRGQTTFDLLQNIPETGPQKPGMIKTLLRRLLPPPPAKK